MYKYAFYRVCKDAAAVTRGNASSSEDSAASRRHVTISLRANQLDDEVVYQMMTMFRQQRRGAGGSGRGCWMSVDLRQNRIAHLLDGKAVSALTRYGETQLLLRDQPSPTNRATTVLFRHYRFRTWRGGVTGKAFGLAISRSQVQILLGATLRNNPRQVVCTYVPLSPSSIAWYRQKGGDALWLGR